MEDNDMTFQGAAFLLAVLQTKTPTRSPVKSCKNLTQWQQILQQKFIMRG